MLKRKTSIRRSRKPLRAPVALVTGAGKRLGRQIALALAQNGFDVVVNYHASAEGAASTVRAVRKAGQRAHAIRADISQRRDVEAMISESYATFGRIDLLVNNSAVFRRASLKTATDAVWDEALGINLKGAFLTSQAVSPHMIRQGGGCIINIASLGGLQAWKEHLPYSISKAGVIMLTKILARELAPTIRVNAIAPGTIILPGEESADLEHVPATKIPLGRYGKASDITDLVIFLATRAPYITGQIIAVDGGRLISLS